MKIVLFFLSAVFFFNGCFGQTQGELNSTSAEKYAGYNIQGILLSPTEAKAMLDNQELDILLLDFRSPGEYQVSHIPGAHNIKSSQYTTASANGKFGGMRIDREQTRQLLSGYGATPDTLIMLYDGSYGFHSTRLWWLLEMYGHTDVAIIDGGFYGWEAAEFRFTREKTPERSPTNYVFPQEGRGGGSLAEAEDILAAQNDSNIVVIDTRSRGEYTGAINFGASTVGRIPWAVWYEYKEAVNAGNLQDKTFLYADELVEKFAAMGITPDKQIIGYCHSSFRATHTYFVLTKLLNYPDVKIYDGAWLEWAYLNSVEPDKYPVVKGD